MADGIPGNLGFQAQAGLADLVLEEKTEWLHDLLEIYIVRKSAYVVVGLDDR